MALCLTTSQMHAIPVDLATIMGGVAVVASMIYGYFKRKQVQSDIPQLPDELQVHIGKFVVENAQNAELDQDLKKSVKALNSLYRVCKDGNCFIDIPELKGNNLLKLEFAIVRKRRKNLADLESAIQQLTQYPVDQWAEKLEEDPQLKSNLLNNIRLQSGRKTALNLLRDICASDANKKQQFNADAITFFIAQGAPVNDGRPYLTSLAYDISNNAFGNINPIFEQWLVTKFEQWLATNLESMKVLRQFKANPNIELLWGTEDGMTYGAALENIIEAYKKYPHQMLLQEIENLLRDGANPNDKVGCTKEETLLDDAHRRKLSEVEPLLIKYGAKRSLRSRYIEVANNIDQLLDYIHKRNVEEVTSSLIKHEATQPNFWSRMKSKVVR